MNWLNSVVPFLFFGVENPLICCHPTAHQIGVKNYEV